jgi:two-component system chemotaxis response regulator CheY
MSKKILVADDSPTVRKAAESLLRKHGYEVLCAEEGASALDLAKASKPDLIFWDASLPALDGRGVCEELKGNDELRDTPLIITLTGEQADKEEELRQLGADAFAIKPFNPKEIVEKVQEFLQGELGDLPAETPAEAEAQPADAEEPSGTDKPQESSASSEEKQKADESLDIIETSDFLESFKDAISGSEAAEDHGFDWFMDELRKELDEIDQADLGTKPKTKEKASFTETASLPLEESTKEDEGKKKEKVYQIDEEQKGYEDFLGELKRESEEIKIEESSDQKIPSVDYDEMVCDLIEKISAKVAQEVAKKIDPETLRKTLQDEVEKLRR